MQQRLTLEQMEMVLREAGSVTDFPALMGNLMYRRLIQWFNAVPQDYVNYVDFVSVQDFRPQTLIVGAESEDLLPVTFNGEYQDSALFDRYAQVQVGIWGRLFRVARTVIVNDDLGYINQQPQRFGRAAARTLAKYVPRNILEANPQTFDGQPLFSATHTAGTGTYSNLTSGAGSALSISAITSAIQNMAVATAFDGVLRPVTPDRIVAPVSLKFLLGQILHSAQVFPAGGGTLTISPTTSPLDRATQMLEAPLMPVLDRYLTNQTAWYLFADPNEIPAVVLAFLRGNRNPTLMAMRPQMINLAGGEDPFMIEVDDYVYKVRAEWGGAPVAWWGAYKMAGV